MNQLKVIKTFTTITLLAGIMLCYSPENGFAQEKPKHEIELGIGIGAAPAWNEFFITIGRALIGGLFPGGEKVITNESFGAISIGYKYRVTDRLDVGGIYVYQHFSQKILDSNDNKIGTGDINWHTLMATLDFYWIETEMFGLFSGIGAGVAVRKLVQRKNTGEEEGETLTGIALQVNGLGIEFGRKFNVSLTVGVGYEGLLVFNVGYRF